MCVKWHSTQQRCWSMGLLFKSLSSLLTKLWICFFLRYESNHRFWTAPFEDDDIVDKVFYFQTLLSSLFMKKLYHKKISIQNIVIPNLYQRKLKFLIDKLTYLWCDLLLQNSFINCHCCVLQVALESMTSRTINFTGKFEPVKWACRAPLQNGKLCPRRDRVKVLCQEEIKLRSIKQSMKRRS